MLAILVALPASPACAEKVRPEVAPALNGGDVSGRVAFEMLPDPDRVKPVLTPEQLFTGPVPLKTPLPEYPQEALDSEAEPAILVVRIIVEEDGTVREVLASPLAGPIEASVREPFWCAVEQAVRRWEFVPAIIRTLTKRREPGGEGVEDDRRLAEVKAVRTYLDLRFKFEVVDGRGQVQLEQNH